MNDDKAADALKVVGILIGFVCGIAGIIMLCKGISDGVLWLILGVLVIKD